MMNDPRKKNVARHLLWAVLLSCLAWLAILVGNRLPAQDISPDAPDPIAAVIDDDTLNAAVRWDRLQFDAQRLAQFVETLARVAQALPEVAGQAEAIRTALDPSVDPALAPTERWFRVLEDLTPWGEAPVPDKSAEGVILEALTALGDEIRAAQSTEVDMALDPGLHQSWTFGEGSVRYAQTTEGHRLAEVWLQAPMGRTWVRGGETVELNGVRIRLLEVTPREDGKFRLRFLVDGEPVSFDW